jgi:hypothetical protein
MTMKVKVRPEFTGSMRFRLTFTLPRIGHCVEHIRAETWTRTQSVEALDMLQYVYGISRQNVRFIHH